MMKVRNVSCIKKVELQYLFMISPKWNGNHLEICEIVNGTTYYDGKE
jgi:hypothetical protein